MPSVLVELGFITNKSDRSTLATKEKRTQLASRVFAAFEEFKEQYDNTVAEVPSEPLETTTVKVTPTVKEETAVKEEPVVEKAEPVVDNPNSFYAIQIFAVSRNIASGSSDFKGLKEIEKFKSGNIFKYTTGHFKSEQDAQAALSSVRGKFKDAFVVKVDDGKVEKVR